MRDKIHDDQSFEQSLYSLICAVFPETTVRSFSAALGKSAGYWSSVSAQGLKVSNAALLYLIDHLECKKILLDASSARRQSIEKIQQKITTELLTRLEVHICIDAIQNSLDKKHKAEAVIQPLPFIILQSCSSEGRF